jgi:hypothetical protein
VAWSHWVEDLATQKWVVYAKPPFGGPRQVLKYLARYIHRVAISNSRLVSLKNGEVTFQWKDYARGNRQRLMTLHDIEFLRRFLLHILPSGFMRIRHYGFLANRVRAEKLARIRSLLKEETHRNVADDGANESHADPQEGAWRCPVCKEGHLVHIECLPRHPRRERAPPTLAA